jgi:hypothetical protein
MAAAYRLALPRSDRRAPDLPRTPCPTCWGQGRILEPAGPRRLVAVTCDTCLGTGVRFVVPR